MLDLNAGLLAVLAVFVVGLTQAVRKAIGDKQVERFGPLIAIGVGLLVAFVWTFLMTELPEGMNKWAYFGVHGTAAGLSASGLWSTGKRLFNGK